MTQVVTVQTDFVDLNQMTQGLIERVHETHVILTGPDGIDEGEWVQFAVNLQDGTPGFAGLGRCVRSVDNGDARLPHQRYDLVLDSLQFDQHGQDVYQYILMSRQALHSGEDVAGYDDGYADDEAIQVESVAPDAAVSMDDLSVSMDDLSAAMDDPSAAMDEPYTAMDEPYTAMDNDEEGATRIENPRDIAADLAAATAESHREPEDAMLTASDAPFDADFAAEFASEPPMPVDASETEITDFPPPLAVSPEAPDGDENDAALDEGEFGAAPEPDHAPAPVLDPGERRFVYADGLPLPSAPPRPDIDPGLRVTPAPRPLTTPRRPDDGMDPFQARADPTEEANGVVNGIHSAPPEYDEPEERTAREAQDDSTDSTYPGP